LPDMPNETLPGGLAPIAPLEKTTVPSVADPDGLPATLIAPAAPAPVEKLAVITELLFIPKVTPLLLLKTTVPVLTLCVPAEIPNGVSAGKLALAVILEDPDMPKLTLFELLKTSVPVETLCVPALIPNGT
jgi:hypothetical protein